jgi:hypothetical protein
MRTESVIAALAARIFAYPRHFPHFRHCVSWKRIVIAYIPVIARNEVTKQSIEIPMLLDCFAPLTLRSRFAPLAMTLYRGVTTERRKHAT